MCPTTWPADSVTTGIARHNLRHFSSKLEVKQLELSCLEPLALMTYMASAKHVVVC